MSLVSAAARLSTTVASRHARLLAPTARRASSSALASTAVSSPPTWTLPSTTTAVADSAGTASWAAPPRRRASSAAAAAVSRDKCVVTACLNGVLTDPAKFDIPVTPEQMAVAAKEAYDAGATVVHIHFRDQRPGKGHLPSWDPKVAADCVSAIREAVPEIIVNSTTGTIGDTGVMGGGDLGPTGGPLACLEAIRPEMAALNSGSLNYLKIKKDGSWAWPPMIFENPVEKVKAMLDGMQALGVVPECECFDTGIVRSVAMYEANGMMKQPIHISLVMGVSSGMPAKASWLPLLLEEINEETQWQVIAIGREDIWDLHRKCIELGGNARTGLEDTFYLPNGSRARTSGELIEAMVKMVREGGREPATPAEARVLIGCDTH